MSCYGLIIFFGRPLFLTLFGVSGTDTGTLAATLIIFATAWAPFDGVQVIAAYLLRSVNCAAWASWAVFLIYWFFSLPMALVGAFVFHWGAIGIWVGLISGLILVALALSWKFWQAARHVPKPVA